jgi:chromosome segregation ATPase
MSKHHSAPSVPKFAPGDPDPVSADHALVLKQHAAQIANENCDRALALAHKLSAQLREAQSRINQLEREADELVHRQRVEAETAVAKLQSDADALVERTKREVDERIARVEAEAKNRVSRLQSDLAQSHDRVDRVKAEADKRVARVEANANEHLNRVQTEVETRFSRLEAALVQAECRAERAEQWLVVIRREIEERLMPSFSNTHDRLPPPEVDP